MTVEQATEEMNQAVEALKIAQQHLLEAAAEATQNLSDIKRILGFEQPAMKLAAPVKKLRLSDNPSKISGRRPPKSPEELLAELKELEAQETPDKKASARKAQIRWLLRKKGALDPAPDRTIKHTEPIAEPAFKGNPHREDGPAIANVEIKIRPEFEKPKIQAEQYKVLIHDHGLWKIKKICTKEEAQKELETLTFAGYEARIKRIQ